MTFQIYKNSFLKFLTFILINSENTIMTLLTRIKETAKRRGISIEEVANQASNSSKDVKISRSSLYQ